MKSTMKAMMYFVSIAMGSVLGDMAGECHMAGFYLELGCTPVPKGDNSTCPDAFACPDLHPDPSICYYRGVAYDDGSYIPQNLIRNPCSVDCHCSLAWEPSFDCSIVDCFFGYGFRKDCITTDEPGSCCSHVNSVCGKDAISKLATCKVDGKTYYAGQTFEPKNYRKTCICTADWDGQVDNKAYCRDLDCGLEIHHQSHLMKNCAPVFYESRGDCPINYECPSPTTNIIRGLNPRNISSECVFGNEILRVGDMVSSDKRCVTCSCKIPPFVSCQLKYPCND